MRTLIELLSRLKPYRWMVLAGIFCTAGTAAADLAVPRLTQRAIDMGITPGRLDIVISSALGMVGMAAIHALLSALTGVLAARASQGLAFDLRNELFGTIQRLSYANLDRHQTGQLMTRVSSDVDMVRLFVSMGMRMLTRAPLMILGSLVLIYLTSPRLAVLMLVLLPLSLLVIAVFAGKARPLFKRVQEKLAALNTVLQENLAGVRVVKAFVRETFEVQRFAQRNQDYYRQNVQVGLLLSFAFPVLFLILNLSTLAVLWFGGRQVIDGALTVGQLVAFNNYVLTTMFPLMMLSMMIAFLSGAGASAERIAEILESRQAVAEPESPIRIPHMNGQIAFEGVDFRYNGSGEPVLKGISFVAEAGEKVALLGATGAGKTSLVNLIPRFYDVTAGRVTIDGVDVRHMAFSDLRGQIGIVPQNTVLFEGTVRENIAFGRPEASEEEVMAAARIAQAHDFIMAMSERYDSHVEARGANLSGGQRQRIAMARAIVSNPRILIFDDSTSSVDLETEFAIQEGLNQYLADRTSIIIAQRISSVLGADKIIVLERGQVAAAGSHNELLAGCPIYGEIYRSQMNSEPAVETSSSPSRSSFTQGAAS